jgi:hypothetical protein
MMLDDYLNLIPSEYRDKPKFVEMVRAFLKPLFLPGLVLDNMDNHFNVSDALGLQLDMVGELIGLKRTLNFQPSGGYSAVMSDEDYRFALKAKIAKNQWDGTTESILSILAEFLIGYEFIIQDNQDMSMSVEAIGLSSGIQKQLFRRGYIVPKPEGVRLEIITSEVINVNQYVYSGSEAMLARQCIILPPVVYQP